MRILELFRSRLSESLQGLIDDPQSHAQRVAVSKEIKFGDYQANLAMGVAKQLGKDPVAVAQEIIGRLQIADVCDSMELAGKGFINFRLSPSWIASQLRQIGCDDQLGVRPVEKSRTFVVDFSSPNVAKPMHVGHIRSTVIGDAIVRTLRAIGHRVISDNHLGDWGTQFGMVIYGYKHFRNEDAFRDAPVQELSRLYRLVQQIIGYQDATRSIDAKREAVTKRKAFFDQSLESLSLNPNDKKLAKSHKANERALAEAEADLQATEQKIDSLEEDPSFKKLASEHEGLGQRVLRETALLHEGDSTNKRLWTEFLPHCADEIHRIYDRLHVHFDYELGESYYHDMLSGIVDKLQAQGTAFESEGAVCIFVDGFEAPMLIRKQDGAYLYATTDLATVEYRLQQFRPDAILYVVDHRQSEHFDKLFAVVRKIGITELELTHVNFGTVLGEDGKPFKTRSGSVVGLDYLLDEAVQRAYTVVCDPQRLKAGNVEFSDEEKKRIAEVVGLGAIKYADLMHNRTSDYVFDLDKMVRLDGNTATYIQYMYARSQNILRRAEVQPTSDWMASIDFTLNHSAERDLAIHLIRFEDALHQSMEEYYPSMIAAYLFELAKLFASFYDQCPVLDEKETALGRSRLGLVSIVGRTLRKGLELLGIDTVERM